MREEHETFLWRHPLCLALFSVADIISSTEADRIVIDPSYVAMRHMIDDLSAFAIDVIAQPGKRVAM